MFKVTVKGKTHQVEMVSARALYEMGPALEMFAKIARATAAVSKGEPIEDDIGLDKAMDALLDWFVVFCGNKFTKEDLLDGYPADSIVPDIALALDAVQRHLTGALSEFPTTARPQTKGPGAPTPASAVSRWASMRTAWRKAFRRK